jgi:hypothetical protein
MPSYTCGICGQTHDELPLDIGYQYPADYFKIPEEERSTRIKYTNDLCSIDDTEFYIRGVLALPIQDHADAFCWGVWVQVQERYFHRYVELWDDDAAAQEPAYIGYLSGGIGTYPASDGLAVRVQLQAGGERPQFFVADEQHPLAVDQRAGITMAHVHEFVAPFLDL